MFKNNPLKKRRKRRSKQKQKSCSYICDYDDYGDYDINIQVGEGEDLENFKAHSNILRERSTYFDTALSSNWAKKEGNVFIFKKPNIRPEIFRIVLKFIYTETIDLNVNLKNLHNLHDILVAADEIDLNELIEYIISKAKNLSNEKIILFLNSLKYHQKEYIKEHISKYAYKIFNNSKDESSRNLFLELEDESLLVLIKDDKFMMKEIEIWNNLIKWAIAKNPIINSNTSTWKSKEIEIIKKTIQQFIPYIRFFHISPDDYYDKIHPLFALLPEKLEKDINLYFIDPKIPISSKILQPRIFIDSLIIIPDHIYQINHWIDNTPHSLEHLNYNFKLLLRGSRDGFDLKSFKEKCYNKGPTIVIIKLKDKDKIIGGYNPLNWSGSGEYLSTKKSFIFSFHSILDSSTTILSRVTNDRRAIYDSKNDDLGFCYDLRIFHQTCDFSGSYYKQIITARSFDIEDYEVFEVK